jgi:hypothetical protein
MGAVQFKVLGPLEAVRDERRLGLGGRKPRAVLAVLLLEDGRHVRTDALVDALWGDAAPGHRGQGGAQARLVPAPAARRPVAHRDPAGRIRAHRRRR